MSDTRTARTPRTLPLALLGVALGVVIVVAVLRFAPREKVAPPPKQPDALAGAVLVEDAGPIDEILFHYVQRLEPFIATPYRDFLGTLDPSTKLVAVVPQGGADPLHKFLQRIDATGALDGRTRVVEVPGPISAWSKDRALVLGPAKASDRTGLLIPVPPDPKWQERSNDWRTLAAVAGAMPERFYVNELPLEFDAGDFAVTGSRVLVDVNLFVKNRARGIASAPAMRELVASLLKRDVVMLGAEDGDVPRHHMSMYMAPLGDVMLVGDPRAAMPVVGKDYVPGEPSPDSGDPLHADFSDAMIARFDRAAKDLEGAGYRVVRIPHVAFDDKTYFAYTNGVYETRAIGGTTKKIAWVPQYADDALPDAAKIATLDATARKVYEDLGWTVKPVRVRAAYPYHGTIGCLANVLARRKS
jgi:hypothetical protein